MSHIKKQLFAQLAIMGQSLSSPQRIELLDYLAQTERSVEELSHLSGLSVANTSRHLQQLKQAGLVTVRKQGKQRIYALASDKAVLLIQQLRITAESHLSEVAFLKNQLNHQTQQTVSCAQLTEKIRAQEPVLIVDV
ncbi:MAG: metalloregulator ArsR/SmtB family transcription factor, partial [Thiomicrorhabdus sp.]|nr:metalloregulator ArsR/SmtB family transcription factor [Thiomicrorhabdus sp.]